jgi:hypothetical protein
MLQARLDEFEQRHAEREARMSNMATQNMILQQSQEREEVKHNSIVQNQESEFQRQLHHIENNYITELNAL